MNPIQKDSSGYPLLLAEKPKQPVAKTPPTPTASTTRPANVPPLEWDRRHDAVRSAAREFETFKEQDVAEHLKGKTTRPLTPAEAQQFVADVRSHSIADLVDVLDQNERGLLRGRRMVRVNAPKGYIRKMMNGLHAGEIDQVKQRLVARGWTDKQIKSLDSRFPESPEAAPETLKMSISDEIPSSIAEMLAAIPAPVVHIAPSPPRELKVIRDSRGVIDVIRVSDAG